MVGAASKRSATSVAVPDALRYLVLYGLGGVPVYGVVTFGAVEPQSLFGFQAMAAGLRVLRAVQQLATGGEFVLSLLYVPAPSSPPSRARNCCCTERHMPT